MHQSISRDSCGLGRLYGKTDKLEEPMRELDEQELKLVSGGADAGSKEPPELPDLSHTRTSGTTPDLGSIRRQK